MGALTLAMGFKGTPDEADPELWDDHLGELVYSCRQWLRAGGRVTLTTWAQLEAHERACLAVAGDELRAEQAVKIAQAARSPLGQAMVQAEVDGGEAFVSEALSTFMDGLA